MTSSLRAICTGPREIELQTVELPDPSPGWAVVRVRNCGICGSDLHFYRGEFPAPPGITLGHEISGEVVALGETLTNASVGERVVVEPLVVCRRCRYCLTGNPQLCSQRKLMGTAVDGGLAEFIAVPDYALHRLPDGVPFHVGALAEPLAVSVHGLRLVELEAGESVLILGAGTIGLLSVLVARELGASVVGITARYSHQATLAAELGADHVLTADEPAQLSEFSGNYPIDVVVETVGGEADTLSTALAAVRPGGRISVLGVFTKPVSLHPVALLLKEARMVGSLTYGSPGYRSDFEIALAILERRWKALEPLVTSRVPLWDVKTGLEHALDKSKGPVKISVEP